MANAEFGFKILKTLGSTPAGGWNLELNIIQWGDGEAKYDIRKWSDDHTRMSKGISMDESRFFELKKIMSELTDDSSSLKSVANELGLMNS